MTHLTLGDFWKPRLQVQRTASAKLIDGWEFIDRGLPTFMEAPLTLSDELSANTDPATATILLVSAPGAVGKSTLARQIAYETGAVYVDLAKAEPVGANTLVGGLVRSGLYDGWSANNVAILIDGLDEGRLRVTQEAFEAFLRDINQLVAGRSIPTILFGRTGAIQDAWVVLNNTAVLEIGYYGPDAAANFAEALLRAKRPVSAHQATERKAIELLLSKLRGQTMIDGDRFAGYAPVLHAVAERVIQMGNANALISEIVDGAQPVTLNTVVSSILERERGKLGSLQFRDARVAEKLYLPNEQLDHLIARIYGGPVPNVTSLNHDDAHTYDTALQTWVPEHPFLGGDGVPSTAVFEAVIAVRALTNSASADVALDRELARGAASANPFLAEFYSPERGDGDPTYLPPEHIGIIYSSIRARLTLGDMASLLVEAPEEGAVDELLRAEVEITLSRRGSDHSQHLRFASEQTKTIRLGRNIEDVDITAQYATVEIGPGPEAYLVAPVSVQCEKLILAAPKVIVEATQDRDDAAIFLEATTYNGDLITVPVVRGSASLAVSWPGATRHPWTSFATNPSITSDPRVDEALRRLRKFVIAFRSHSKGSLARYRAKIDHARMTKGSGQAILDLLCHDRVLSIDGPMYVLDQDRLTDCVGINYTDCMTRRFSEKAVAFVRRALP